MKTPQRLPVCSAPAIFPAAPEVCNTCGNLIDAHGRDPGGRRYLEAMWKVMVTLGGIHDVYSGVPLTDHPHTEALREHMATCRIDPEATTPPTMEGASRFADSEAENSPLVMLNGRLTCRCRQYFMESISVTDLTMGQLIWHVVHADEDQQPALEAPTAVAPPPENTCTTKAA